MKAGNHFISENIQKKEKYSASKRRHPQKAMFEKWTSLKIYF